MNKFNLNDRVIHKGNSKFDGSFQHGVVGDKYFSVKGTDGAFLLFKSDTGAKFTVEASELVAE